MNALFLTPEADAEALAAYRWYEGQRRGLGDAFRAALDATLVRVQQTPMARRIVHRDLRRALVAPYPYLVLYRMMGDAIVIVAIVHGSRAPASWQAR